MAGIYGIFAPMRASDSRIRVQDYAPGQINETGKKERELVRSLYRSVEQGSHTGTIQGKENGYLDLTRTKTESGKQEKTKKAYHYNLNELVGKIQRAKTAIGAGKALLSARRKVLEVKRKIASEDGDPDELQMALSHAKRMELVARRKKHHLELEEMGAISVERKEEEDKAEESRDAYANALIGSTEEDLEAKEDEVLKAREEALDKAREEGLSQDLLEELGKMLSDFGEDELKELEEAMSFLEELEFADPNMSEEDLEELKRKHRNSENKAIVKANMEYLRSYIKHQVQSAGTLPKLNTINTSVNVAALVAPVESGTVAEGVASFSVEV